ncbi:MAG: hypothetical protein A3D44_00215 [Candidatus Staskawiczbacteria bacterium RIFCSPHIGHO2_02_FULL_42_22]|uniref:Carbonic anhydrase n=1 Tax=Candidatus Staskawiczbacteria bacterium RIFCSPHIGHO2_02_FULL_42_22 TaxID=1802207 RepID=A0A1G2I2F5_9BACT|nr:MAG: hypothetical protein A3D44_00215 [Candidatus Staskawiczbacteria bacterium RIFCSPHIGHO2_02_FULL_42_22]
MKNPKNIRFFLITIGTTITLSFLIFSPPPFSNPLPQLKEKGKQFSPADIKKDFKETPKNVEKTNETCGCAIACMDGKAYPAVIAWQKKTYHLDSVDLITDAGPDGIVAQNKNSPIIANIQKNLELSIHGHQSRILVLAAHENCLGDPVSTEEHCEHLRKAKKIIEGFEFKELEKIVLVLVKKDRKTVIEISP